MTTLVEKVADAIGKAIRQSGYVTNPEMDNHIARAAIATVLREMMDQFHILGSDENDKIWKDTLRAFDNYWRDAG